MTSTFTPNINLEEPARGDDVGTWDTPVNANMSVIDLAVGAIATQALSNSNIVLSASQFKCRQVTFTGALVGSVTITFPTSFTKSYEIFNATTAATPTFTVTLQTTASGGQVICAPPGDTVTVYNDGSSMRYTSLERIGTLVDFCTAFSPTWITGCTVPPYLVCDGSTFNATTYNALNNMIGANRTPDMRGRIRAMLNVGTNRITTAGCGVNGDALFSVGGDQLLTSHTHTASAGTESAQHTHQVSAVPTPNSVTYAPNAGAQFGSAAASTITTGVESATHTHAITVAAAGSGGSQNMPPVTIVGLTMIRAG